MTLFSFIKLYFLKAILLRILVFHGRCLISSPTVRLIFVTILKTEKTVSNNLFRTPASRCHTTTPNFSLMPEHLGMKEDLSSSVKDSRRWRPSESLSKFNNRSILSCGVFFHLEFPVYSLIQELPASLRYLVQVFLFIWLHITCLHQVCSESYPNFLGISVSKSAQVTDLCLYLSDVLIPDSYQ